MALAVLLTGCGVLLVPGAALACSCLCLEARVVPVSGGDVPANAPALTYLAAGFEDDEPVGAADLVLERIDGEAPAPHPFTLTPAGDGVYHLALDEPLTPGARYRLTGPGCSAPVVSEFQATEPMPLPAELGALVVSHGTGTVTVPSAECSQGERAGWADVEVELVEAARPWADLLMFETWVDDRRWSPRDDSCAHYPPGQSWRGRGRDRVYTLCGGSMYFGRDPGEHSVVMRASLALTDVSLSTDPEAIHLSCDEGGCSTVAASESGAAAWPVVPALLVLCWAARRQKRL